MKIKISYDKSKDIFYIDHKNGKIYELHRDYAATEKLNELLNYDYAHAYSIMDLLQYNNNIITLILED